MHSLKNIQNVYWDSGPTLCKTIFWNVPVPLLVQEFRQKTKKWPVVREAKVKQFKLINIIKSKTK